MAKLSLNSIRRENARLVLEAIARKKHITKLEIAEETGLSLMTAGKLVSVLGSSGIITRSMSASQKVGRRAEVFRIRRDWLIPVFDISTRVFKFMIADLEGTIVDRFEYTCVDEPTRIANEFIIFLGKTVEFLKSKYKNKKALGIGVAISGVYDADNDCIRASMIPEFSSLKVMHNISKIFKTSNVVIDNANRLSAAGLIENTEDYRDKTISCITINDGIECTTCEHGVYVKGSNNLAGRLGDIVYSTGYTYASFIRNAQNVEDILSPTVKLLETLIISYDPDTIYMCSDKFVFHPQIKDKIYSSVLKNLFWPNDKRPSLVVVNSNTLESVNAIVTRIISNWLDSLLAKEE